MGERETWMDLIRNEYDADDWDDGAGRIADAIIADKALLESKIVDDPSADERWNAGVDMVMKSLCDYLGVDPNAVTDLFFKTVWEAATAVLFLRGRLFFHVSEDSEFERKGKTSILVKAGGAAPANAGAPSVLCAYGRADAVILRDCGLDGKFIDLRPECDR